MPACYTIPLNVEQLLAKAREITGITLVDTEVVEPLTILLDSINTESCLHEAGAIAKQDKLLRLLCNRLRMMRDYAAHPEIADEKIEAPVFILGMARSGTTKTHRVISATGDFNYMPFWMVQYPSLLTGDRSESPQARIDAADQYCNWLDDVAPEIRPCHSFETHAAEEDSLLTEQCFIAPSFLGYSEVPSYMKWMVQQGMSAVFRMLRDTLKYLQWQGLASGNKRWLLKAPSYYGGEADLLSVFPDAKIVMTHRSPLSTVPSLCKLVNLFHLPFGQAQVEPLALHADLAAGLNAHMDNRENLPNLEFLDFLFEDAVSDMEGVAEQIYAYAGVSFSEQSRQKIRNWDTDNPIHKKGKFVYSLEEFGLTEVMIERDMARYIAFIEQLKNKKAG